jgi:hypothetical protein
MPSVEFCILADMPNIYSIADAIKFWSNRFKSREHKAIEQLIASYSEEQKLDIGNPKDKGKIIAKYAVYIERLVLILEAKYKDTGINQTRCALSAISFEVDTSRVVESLSDFAKLYGDANKLKKQCRLYDFVTRVFKSEIELYVANATGLPKNESNKGFIAISEKLEKIIKKGESECNCRCCGYIGDAVIALDTPRSMRLEHTDRSFNHLCPLINKPHKEHPSATALLKQ